MTSPSITETLANAKVIYILWIAVGATLLRIALIRTRTEHGRSAAEILESALIAVVLVYMIIRPFMVQAYFIPSPSMVPTLLGENGSGDRILVNKLVYRVNRPNRDDVVVFIPPDNVASNDDTPDVPVNFIKRLIALPGDVLQVTAGRIIINGTAYSHFDLRNKLAQTNFYGPSPPDDLQAEHHIRFTSKGVFADGKRLDNTQLSMLFTNMPSLPVQIVPGKTVLNGHVLSEPFTAEDPDYDLKIFNGQSLKTDDIQGPRLNGTLIPAQQYNQDNLAPPGAIPKGTYFMMGDNRNDSRDSTEWGPLDGKRVVGQAVFIFWPLNRIGLIRNH
ncbi:MAG: signal peptidase I [Capsulimonadaceae bacterium]